MKPDKNETLAIILGFAVGVFLVIVVLSMVAAIYYGIYDLLRMLIQKI